MLKKIQSQVHDHKNGRLIAIMTVIALILLVVICIRIYAAITLKKETLSQAIPVVNVIAAQKGGGTEPIILPGNVQAWHEATIYARTSGYIKKWYVDIGSHVKGGQLLAEIETPELDAQLRQAEADLNTAIANNNLAQSTALRWANLLKSHSVSKQEADEKTSSASALKAIVIASQANVDRLKQLVSFERIVAPFDGVITSRTTDIGSLINAGSSTTGVALFQIVQSNPLRIYVRVPQTYSSRITPNMVVSLSFAEHPGQKFSAKLLETSQALDPVTRTLLAQFVVENKEGTLLAGGYTEVTFTLPVPATEIRLPVNTLLFRAEGLSIAVVDKNNKVVLKPVKISRDFGSEVEVQSGIQPGEKIIINPPDSLVSGQSVRIAS